MLLGVHNIWRLKARLGELIPQMSRHQVMRNLISKSSSHK
jgi:hypothetical protein